MSSRRSSKRTTKAITKIGFGILGGDGKKEIFLDSFFGTALELNR